MRIAIRNPTGLRGFAASHCRANEDRFDPVSRDEADSSANDLPITGLGIKVLGASKSCGARIREVGPKPEMTKARLYAMIGTLLLGGCAVGPDYHRAAALPRKSIPAA